MYVGGVRGNNFFLMIPVPLRSLMEHVPAGSFPEKGSAGTYLCPENGPKGCWNPGEDADGNPVVSSRTALPPRLGYRVF